MDQGFFEPPPAPDASDAIRIQGSQPAGCSTCGNKTAGLVGLVKGLAYGPATPEVQQARFKICQACEAVDPSGERFFRCDGMKCHCGSPRLASLAGIIRDEKTWGCGCELTFKTSRAQAECPLGKWPADSRRTNVKKLDAVLRVEANGIGDLCTAACVVAGFKHGRISKNVALEVRPHLKDWARLFMDADELRIHGTTRAGNLISLDNDFEAERKDGISRHVIWADKAEVEPRLPTVQIPMADRAWAESVTAQYNRPLVALAPYSAFGNRSWPMRRWIELEDLLLAAGFDVLVLDGPGDGGRTQAFKGIRYWGQAPGRVAALLARCKVVVGNDSGMCHLAGVLKVRAVAICGPNDGFRVFGFYGCVDVINATMGCAPCYWRGEYQRACDQMCEALFQIQAWNVAEAVHRAARI